MGRIEKGENMKEEVANMKGEVVKEIRRIDKGGSRLTCSLLFFAFVFGVLMWFGWIVASTGLYTVPLLSSIAYENPEPARIVAAGTPLETVVQEQVQTILTRRLQQGGGVLNDTNVALTLNESSFTSTLQSSIAEGDLKMFDEARVQVMIQEDGTFELFLPLRDRSEQTAFVATMRVELMDGTVNVTTDRVRLGAYVFPKLLVEFFSDTVIKPQIPQLNAALGGYARINDLSYETGRVTINGTVDVEIIR